MARLEIQSDIKPFTMIKNTVIDSENILNEHEKLLYIVLLRYGTKAFPSLATLSKKCGFSKRTVQRTIDTLIEKGLLKKKNQISKKNGNTSNIYTLIDNDKIWNSSEENLKENIDAVILEEAIKIVETSGMKVLAKEREPVNEPTKAHTQAPNNQKLSEEQNITDKPKSQEERYTLEEIHQLFDYDILTNDYPKQQQDIDCVMDVLHTALNTSKPTIRVSGEDKPTMVVISKLMKLDKDDIMYALNRFAEQTERVKNPTAYLLTILYSVKEQYHFDTINQVSHDMAHWEDKYHEKPRKAELERNLLQESSYLYLQKLSDRE